MSSVLPPRLTRGASNRKVAASGWSASPLKLSTSTCPRLSLLALSFGAFVLASSPTLGGGNSRGGGAIRFFSAFRQPVVFPPMDAAKYLDTSTLGRSQSFDQLPEEQILTNDGVEPEENHEHADDVELHHQDLISVENGTGSSNESTGIDAFASINNSDSHRPGEPVAMPQRGSAPRVKAPEHSLAVWDSDGTICILARFQAFFTIPYATAVGMQYASMKMPPNRELGTRGVCSTDSRDPQFEVQWPLFKFIMHFTRSRQRSSWYVNKLEVQYNTNSPLFPGALKAGRRYASTTHNISLFMTPMGQSYGCPLHPPLALAIVNSSAKIMVKLKDMRLQAYQLTGNYGPLSRCQQVAMAHTLDPYNYDRTVPVAVGSTLAGVSIATVVGYALYRSVFARKVDYGAVQ
ncbi:lysosome-associated membrane glycoprotein 5-like [Varroa destructor]|uniref:Lysosome-associated membrane glycoprotein 5 n=1 Tax=Varroa destructor TaxID=109461 RepID=A0A7M7JUJ4_VARDE|nr:lysosome-associated membrane glycoprotein 5-like [Varroa destructor]